ncbi:MAG: hypothetical protein LCI00_22060 [Chloroflexi bacterium]|nr:hypothetical protein [Chloroflexota bacterium]MCC6895151.1 hypothetical protein [Anaerolineae bacterium]
MRYSPAHKKLILRLVKEAFRGDIAATARYAEVPERTLRDWMFAARRAAASRKPAAAAPPVARRRI